MSSTTTSAAWASIGTSGSWTDATNWNPASVPGASTNVLIGTATVNTTSPWTVSVAGSQSAAKLTLEMGSGGTLAIAGTVAVAGDASLGYGSVRGAVVNLAAGAALSVAGNTVATDSTFLVNGATITTGGYADLDGDSVTVQNGVWNGQTIWIGQFFNTGATVGAGAQMNAAAVLNVGYGGTAANPFTLGTGSVYATGGGLLTAPVLKAVDGSLVSIDAQSAIDLGGAASVAGALAVGAAGTLALEAAKVAGNVVDDGMLTALADLGASSLSIGTGPIVTGSLSGTGSVQVGAGYTLEVGAASGFSGAISIAKGGTLRIDAGGAPGGTISMRGGTVDLRGLTFGTGSGPTIGYSGGTLTVGADTLNVGTGLSAGAFSVTADVAGGTDVIEIACYAAGTRIATETGEAAVETLRPGDRMRTAAGRIAPVLWVGRTTVALVEAPHAAPVRIAAGAFGPGLPRRDLLVSPDHALAVEGALIPAGKLVNGATIRREPARGTVTYVHVELDRHDLLLAEGLAAESYLDTGNRFQFAGAGARSVPAGDPEAAVLRAFAERGCAPLLLRGPQVAAAHARLRAGARALGWELVTDPALRLACDLPGTRIAADGADALRVIVPPGARALRLTSRSFVPDALDPACGDGRRLGVAMDVECDGAWLVDAAFGPGWYPADAGVHWRWTDGEAVLRLPGPSRAAVLTLHLLRAGGRYWVRREELARAA